MKKEEKRALQMLVKHAPEKMLKDLKSEMNKNRSFIKDLSKKNEDLDATIRVVERFKNGNPTSNKKKTSKRKRRTVSDEIRSMFAGTQRSKSVQTVYNRLKRKGVQSNFKTVNTLLSQLADKGEISRVGRGQYKIKDVKTTHQNFKTTHKRRKSKKGSQLAALSVLKNSDKPIMTFLEIKKSLIEMGFDNPRSCENALDNLRRKGEIIRDEEGRFRIK